MITLCVSEDGVPTVWNAEDWLTLREEHRIIGELIGVPANLPIQDIHHGLPMTLLPEEATLLVERNVARLVRFPSLTQGPADEVLNDFKNHRNKTYHEQAEQLREDRKKTLRECVDRIIEGRRRKHLGLNTKKKNMKKTKKQRMASEGKSTEDADREEETESINDAERESVIEEELAKFPPLLRENALVQTFTAYPWLKEEDACPVEWTFPSTSKEKLRYQTFKDLWEKGYYISPGHKFGGDFIAYPGDPVKFHSQFIVICIDNSAPISAQQFVTFGRIGSTVRKTVVLASISSSDNIIYQSIKWAGKS